MPKTINRVSDEAVKKATGKTWDEWVVLLDKAGAQKMTHTEIAQWLEDKKHIKSSWWCQMVTVGYEYAKGRRIVGETADVGFEIGVTKTLPISKKQAWDLLMSPAGMKTWLGKAVKLEKGQTYTAAEGTTGEIRTLKPGERVRLTWQPKEFKQPSTLQVTVIPSGQKTSIRFHHEKLSSKKAREDMRRHWQQVLNKLQELTGSKA
jgi:uncharacterized protein YndB with AHSA1/START domain